MRQAVDRHETAVDVLIGMLIDSIGDDESAADQLNNAPVVLPVRALQSIVDDYRDSNDVAKVDMVRLAFLFVAVHALTDPTNCATASRNLNLVPPPLHRDRAVLGRVMAHALPTFTARDRDLFAVYVSKASAFFAVPALVSPTFRGRRCHRPRDRPLQRPRPAHQLPARRAWRQRCPGRRLGLTSSERFAARCAARP